MPIKNAKSIQSKAKKHQVTPTGPATFTVTSGNSGNEYQVTIHGNNGECTCTWASYRPSNDRRSGCSHVLSCFGYLAQDDGRKASAWSDEQSAKRQHKSYFGIGDGLTLTLRKAA